MDFLNALRANADDLARLVARTPATAPVTWCAGWDLSDLARHVGATHRWVAAMITEQAPVPVRYKPFAESAPTDPADLATWLDEGAATLCATFETTDPASPVWTWTSAGRADYWLRRMVHEILVHRADATHAVDGRVDIPADLAIDGIAEFLELLPAIAAGRRVDLTPLPAGVALVLATGEGGPAWRVEGGTPGITWSEDAGGEAAARVTGDPAWLYLWLWGRDANQVTIEGDAAIVESWRTATRV